MRTRCIPKIAVAAFVMAVVLAVAGAFVWDMTTTAYFGQPGHFTRSVEHQIYPHRAEALWLTAVVFAARGVCVVLPRPLAALMDRRATAR